MDTSWMHPDFLQAAGAVPAYQQIYRQLKRKIQEETLLPGALLPGELELSQAFSVCRTTVRRAFQLLEEEGLVVRKKGKGSFVATPQPRTTLQSLYRFSQELRKAGRLPEIRVLSIRKSYPSPVLAKLLETAQEHPVVKIDRLFLLDQEPVFLEATCIPACYFPDCSAEVCSDTLWQLLFSGSEIQPMEAVETYDAALLSEKQAALLQCPAGSAAFQIQRVSREQHGAVFEVSRMVAPAGKNKLSLTFQPGGVRVSHPWIEPKTDG